MFVYHFFTDEIPRVANRTIRVASHSDLCVI